MHHTSQFISFWFFVVHFHLFKRLHHDYLQVWRNGILSLALYFSGLPTWKLEKEKTMLAPGWGKSYTERLWSFFFFFFFLTEYTFSYHFTLKLDAIVHMEGVDCLLACYLNLHIITITFFFWKKKNKKEASLLLEGNLVKPMWDIL